MCKNQGAFAFLIEMAPSLEPIASCTKWGWNIRHPSWPSLWPSMPSSWYFITFNIELIPPPEDVFVYVASFLLSRIKWTDTCWLWGVHAENSWALWWIASPVTGCPIEILPNVAFPIFSLKELILLYAEEVLGVEYDFLGSYILTSPFAEPAMIICCPPTVSSYKNNY